ncbi:LamG domain-containing protein [Streptomyces sp. ME18-1-4]|uniref:LamG domain-containing protein n=1 Tax=Streptomyces sp. ME18-1-4 TaxID=3028685 RepID=UPI0029A57032|nr:LamG domain-containing protein [Streptomyces sp. ME18-1-4]MDX3247540.1 LamG domain-containing protein [Streptomyces sp. ME18-1-4]
MAAVPWTAAAAENRLPSQPRLSELKTGNDACAAGVDRPYVDTRPRLSAVLRDPDGGQVSAEFEASWTDAAGVAQTRTGSTVVKPSGSPFTWTVPDDVPPATEVTWRVRASDGTGWGPWSSDGTGATCEFVYDAVSPEKPSVGSPDYPADDKAHGGVGVYGAFTFDSPSDDVVSYVYETSGGVQGTVRPDEPGGPATLRWMPTRSGPVTLTVRAADRAGRSSDQESYTFVVASDRTPAAVWTLADAAGASEAAASVGGRPATAGAGVAFGASGPPRTGVAGAAELDGSAAAYLTSGAPAVDIDAAFSVSAWVRPDATGGPAVRRTAVSQGGARLGTDSEGNWSFGLGAARATGGAADTGEWTHLVGVHDPVRRTASLYVNGLLAATAEDVATPVGSGTGDLQIGRAAAATGDNWRGALAEVRLWDRIVVADEATEAAARRLVNQGHWALDEATGDSSPEDGGGSPLTLGGDATIFHAEAGCDDLDPNCLPAEQPMAGAGHLQLDGDGDFAATGGAVADTADSFTVGARVRIDEAAQGRNMTVLSLPGRHNSMVSLRYSGEQQRWQAVLAHGDTVGAETTTLTAEQLPVLPGQDHYVALAYDNAANEVRLYVDGETAARAPYTSAWSATSGLQVGRGLTADGGWGGYLHGAVDDVRVYEGAVSDGDLPLIKGQVE